MMLDSPHTSAPMLMRGNDTARLTRHTGVPGRRRRVGGAAADSPSHFSSPWAPGEARSRRCSRVKQAHNGSRRAAVAPGPRATNTLATEKKVCTTFLHTRCCQPCHCAKSGPRARRDGAFCRFMCESGHRNSASGCGRYFSSSASLRTRSCFDIIFKLGSSASPIAACGAILHSLCGSQQCQRDST